MIWCVEDDASIRDIEVYALTSTGFEAKGFEDGSSFWNALQSGTPELVVLDVMLPGKDGVELLRMMKGSKSSGISLLLWQLPRAANTTRSRAWIWVLTIIW